MLNRKSLSGLTIAGLLITVVTATASADPLPNGDVGYAGYESERAQYARVNGHWKRIDLPPARTEQPAAAAHEDIRGFVKGDEGNGAAKAVDKVLPEKRPVELMVNGGL